MCPTDGMSVPQVCPDGQYQTGTGQQDCDNCTEGYSCLNKDQSPASCPAGLFAPAGSTSCSNCGAGKCHLGPSLLSVDLKGLRQWEKTFLKGHLHQHGKCAGCPCGSCPWAGASCGGQQRSHTERSSVEPAGIGSADWWVFIDQWPSAVKMGPQQTETVCGPAQV